MKGHVHLHQTIKALRKQGLTYGEINTELRTNIPKSSLSYICKGIILSSTQQERIKAKNHLQLRKNQRQAVNANRRLFENKVEGYRKANAGIAQKLRSRDLRLVALAMLYLGEGSKWKNHRGLTLVNTNSAIIITYIHLLRSCYGVPLEKMRGRIQHRADQDPTELLNYWSNITGIGEDRFYPCYIDKRTIGKTTTKPDYKGICAISCSGTHIQLELEQIADIISKTMGRWRSW